MTCNIGYRVTTFIVTSAYLRCVTHCDWLMFKAANLASSAESYQWDVKHRDSLEVLGVDWRIILKCILKKMGGNIGTGFLWVKRETIGWSCQQGNEPSRSVCAKDFVIAGILKIDKNATDYPGIGYAVCLSFPVLIVSPGTRCVHVCGQVSLWPCLQNSGVSLAMFLLCR